MRNQETSQNTCGHYKYRRGGPYDEVRRSVCALAGPSLAPGGTAPARGRPVNDHRRSPVIRRRRRGLQKFIIEWPNLIFTRGSMHTCSQREFTGLSPVAGPPSDGASGTRTRGFKFAW